MGKLVDVAEVRERHAKDGEGLRAGCSYCCDGHGEMLAWPCDAIRLCDLVDDLRVSMGGPCSCKGECRGHLILD